MKIKSNQDITENAMGKIFGKYTFSQDQLAQLFEGSKEFMVSNSSYEESESRTYIDDNVKMLITKYKVFNRELKYSYLINKVINS